ncbi:copper homeostasis protein CutC [Hymenobacter mucosus]|uniref:PF03932 family protein CutC n=1 Tax=Hymenobacter mucosus TaxID=1411120 RepID=A0A238X885_9BACT|nr:copper homeostasis protein CutC [Hymenobacter mucosus]SNR54554.1 copper homeostasis protein [Hymenobacter mucosus]
MNRVLEICANSVQSAVAAQAGGAHRIELCQNLEQGGITPSYGLIRQVRALLTIPVFVLIRPRPGNFVYDAAELAIMQADIQLCQELGCAGVVLGVLDAEDYVDVACCRELVALAHPLQVTFHRAFDSCANQQQALEAIIGMGCQRLLTSGGQPSATAGITQLAALVEQAAGRISIMPGAGITPETLPALVRGTSALEFHSSAKRLLPTVPGALPELNTPLLETDDALVARMVKVLEESS